MLYWNVCTKSLDRCYAQQKLVWPNQFPPVTLMSFLTMQHGQFALPIIQYLKPYQMQPFSDKTCSLIFRLWLTGIKLENTGDHWLIAAISIRIIDASTMITSSEIKYLLKKKVYSTKQSLNMAKSNGLSQQFIKWNNKDSIWNQIEKTQYLESNTIHRQNSSTN